MRPKWLEDYFVLVNLENFSTAYPSPLSPDVFRN